MWSLYRFPPLGNVDLMVALFNFVTFLDAIYGKREQTYWVGIHVFHYLNPNLFVCCIVRNHEFKN